MRNLITISSKTLSKFITWTEESDNGYDDLLIAFDNNPILLFLNPNKEIFLKSDAFEHGIGSYLYQLNDRTRQAVRGSSSASFSVIDNSIVRFKRSICYLTINQ
jgi:hypothetical protein